MHGKRRRRSPIKSDVEVKSLTEEQTKPKTGQITTGGVGLLIDSAKATFEGYGTTNPQIIKDARMLPGKI